MTDEHNSPPDQYDSLRAMAELQERPFTSGVPVIGGLIAWFRSVWNSVSTKWYVRPLVDQQTRFNRTVADTLIQHDRIVADIDEMRSTLAQVDARVAAQDRDHVATVHDVGELSAQLTALRRSVDLLEERLAQLEGERD